MSIDTFSKRSAMAVEDLLHPLLSAYLNSPQWVKTSIGRGYSLLPFSWRRGRHYARFLHEAALQTESEIRQLACEKLALTLREVFDAVPAYRQYRDLANRLDAPDKVLRDLPLVCKDDIKRNLQSFVSTGVDPKLRMKVFTGGSTAVPMTFYLHKGVSRTKEYAFIEHFHRRAGLGARDVVLAMRGHAVPGAGSPGGRFWMYEPIKKQLILSCDHLARRFMPEYVQAMRDWKPSCIQAYPSAIYPLALWLQDHPAPDVSERIKSIMLFSENVLDHHMALIRQVFPCSALKHYGHSERVLMAASMPDDERYFFWPQYGHFELIDQAGHPVTRPGTLGEIVGTGYDNRVMPFIRYRTGDMAMLSERPHPLLPGFPAVERIEGRLQEFVVCRDRRLISVNSMTEIPRDAELEGIEAIQFEQHVPGHLLLRIATPRALPPAVSARFAQRIERKAQGGCTVEVMQVGRIARTARGKFQMLIQHLDIRHYFGASVNQ
jgi:phenylacetate-CoA ligase